MKLITSADNIIFKDALSLKQKKYRDKGSLYLAEGPNFIRDAASYGICPGSVFVSGERSGEIDELSEYLQGLGCNVCGLSEHLFERLSDTQSTQGIIAVFKKPHFREDDVFTAGGCVLVLDRIQDPGNMGTIFRTAEAMGFCGIVLVKGCTDIFSPKVVRAAAGCICTMPSICADSSEEALEMIRKHKKRPFAAFMNAALSCRDADIARDAAIIIGNEGNGVDDVFLREAEEICIPMTGKAESLNAAIAASILMYESSMQRKAKI